jgi:hypothetical protein
VKTTSQRDRPRGPLQAPHDADRDVSTSAILIPAAASLSPTVAGEHRHQGRKELVCRIRGEFEEMPGLSLTPVQAIKLFGISPDVCAGILSDLIEEGVLQLRSDGCYARRLAPA